MIGMWTETQDSSVVAERLQEAGIAAMQSMRPDELFHDPHLDARHAWVEYVHPVQGRRFDLRLPWRFSDGACRYGPAPLFGEHNAAVYEVLLGLSSAEVAALEDEGVIA